MKYTLLAIVALTCWTKLQAQNLWDGSTTVTTTSTNGNALLTNGNLSFGTSNTGWPIFINNTTRAGGIYNYSSFAANSTQYGFYNFHITTTTTGNKYGIYNYLTAQNPNQSYGIYSTFSSSGTGARYGIYSTLTGAGTGTKYGIYSVVTSSAADLRYGIYSECTGTGAKAGYFLGDLETKGKLVITGNSQGRFVFSSSVGISGDIADQVFSIIPNTTAGADNWNANKAINFFNSGLLEKMTNTTDKVFSVKRSDLVRDVFRIYGDGKMYATEVNVMLATQFPDYVFKPTYQLMPLSEVRSFINLNGHLPNVPTAETVAEEGINVGEMTKVLVEKVEELTLYLLEQQTLIEKQQAQIDALLQELTTSTPKQ
jgi:hypothetical protein